MRDINYLLTMIKKAAVEAINSTNPVQISYGTVTSVQPLKITIDQKLTLGKAQLVMTQTVKSYLLEKGDKLILQRVQGGQQYIILDRVVE